MKRKRLALMLGASGLLTLVTACLSLWAQDDIRKGRSRPDVASAPARSEPSTGSALDALQRPFVMPFEQPTTLNDVCRHLRMMLKIPVVLDRAALDRQEITGEDTVVLSLHDGIRLKTGLKLLLDQVGLTYRVVPEDNLLVITDAEGADDPLNLVLSQLKALHRDLHDVQDAVEEIRAALGLDEEDAMKMRKPTIIEELPEEGGKAAEKGKDKERDKPKTKDKDSESKPDVPSSSPRSRPGI